MPVTVTGLAHLGIRVHDLARSRAFYELLGFEFVKGPIGSEPVAMMTHPSGLELNFILNAPEAQTPNVLMDVPGKKPGITHVALVCDDLEAARAVLEAAGHAITEGPVEFPGGVRGMFVRDPDGTVIELDQLP